LIKSKVPDRNLQVKHVVGLKIPPARSARRPRLLFALQTAD
jgi:hypothetical protein